MRAGEGGGPGGRRSWRRTAAALAASLALGGCALFGGGGEAETPQQAAAREALDERIRREVEARIAAEPSLASSAVRVEVARGEVQLSGAVEGFGALECAVTNADLTPGVRLVIDRLVLRPGPSDVVCLSPRIFDGPRAPGTGTPAAPAPPDR